MDLDRLARELVEPIKKSVTSLPEKTLQKLREAKETEQGGGKVQLKAMLEAVEVGQKEEVPICQDTGTPTFFIQLGTSFPAIEDMSGLQEALKEAVRKATQQVPIRPNTVDPFRDTNPGDNTGKSIPYIDWTITAGDQLKMTYLPKGGGCTNMSTLVMMNPGRGLEGVREIVLKHIASMEGKPCPPTVVGVGLGGSAVMALEMAKKSLLRPVGNRHPEDEVSRFEQRLYEEANDLGVGPMGVGGKTTVLDVHTEYDHRHPASFPVGITPQCWANRRISVSVTPEGSVEVIK